MAYTQTQLEALQSALANGVLEVEYNGEKVTYRSVPDLLKAIRVVESGLGIRTGVATRRTVASFRSGV